MFQLTENEFNVLYAIKKYDIDYLEKDELKQLNKDEIHNIIVSFVKRKILDNNGITKLGYEILSQYKVNNAIIMAAGMSTRFVPLSLEKPKGLIKVKDEVLIERQIEQLKEAGINKIIIILGYKKELFNYLKDKYKDIEFIINEEYNIKNNTHTLNLAQDRINNTYICSSDNYFEENPFDEYVYESYYSSIYLDEKTEEWYMKPDNKDYIKDVKIGDDKGYIMLGHAYWNHDFSKCIKPLLEDSKYDQSLWEQVLIDNLDKLPKMKIKEYEKHIIHEFDSIDELRQFDSSYINNTNSRIIKYIAIVFNCEEKDITNFKPIKEDNNLYFSFEIDNNTYLYKNEDEIISYNEDINKKAL